MKLRFTLGAALCALLFAGAASAASTDKGDAARQREVEQARKELRDARDELARAAKELARATAKLEPNSPQARAFEFVTNPRRAMLGVGVDTGPERNGELHGVLITAVTPGSGADKAGLKSGDILTSANGKSLVTKKGEKPKPERKLVELMSTLSPGDKVDLEYEREGKNARVTVIAQRPEPMNFPMMDLEDEDLDAFMSSIPPMRMWSGDDAGLQLAKLDDDLASYFQTHDGVLVIKAAKDKDDAVALKSGDVIQSIDGSTIELPVDAMDRLRDAGDKEVRIEVIRHGKHETLKGKSPLKRLGKRKRVEIHGDEEP
ncbi:MAG TPA: PDZ domain-containing protein [Nevskiaceae bacterium]|nr:PDZ domain-containing protein [Nevskiaceae bacterium]